MRSARRAACGVATRLVVPAAAAIYAWLYFGSQLDSYQHHYLVSLVLVLACFVPWQRPSDATPATPVRSWALRLVLVQLAIMYLWAAISKMNSAWLDGRALESQIVGPVRELIDATIGFRKAAHLVVGVELTLAATIWIPRAWRFAAPLGLLLHVGIVFTGLEIGMFAWLMIGIYVFVVPDRVWTSLAELPTLRFVREIVGGVASRLAGNARWIAWIACAAIATALAVACRFEHARAIAMVLTIGLLVATAVAAKRHRSVAWLAAGHLAALATWLAVDRATTVAADYYRFWGGTSRRLGDSETAERAYRELGDVDPDEPTGHFQLGRLLLARDATDDGLAELHEAERLEPNAARAYVAEARWLASHARLDEAIGKARIATTVEPADSEARDLLAELVKPR